LIHRSVTPNIIGLHPHVYHLSQTVSPIKVNIDWAQDIICCLSLNFGELLLPLFLSNMRLRKFIRPARTSDEFLAGETPERHDRHLTNTQNLSSSESSDSPKEPVYKPPKSPKPKYVKRWAYRDSVTEYDPSLPPAAFPTIDNNIPRKDQTVPQSSNVSIEAQPAVFCRHARSDKITSNNSGLAHRPPTHTSRIATVDQPSLGPENVKTIYATNLQKMKQSMEMSSVNTFAREMESSDEDEPMGNVRTSSAAPVLSLTYVSRSRALRAGSRLTSRLGRSYLQHKSWICWIRSMNSTQRNPWKSL